MSLKVVEPVLVTESVLTSSDIAEPDLSVGEVEWIADNYDGVFKPEGSSFATGVGAFNSYFHVPYNRKSTSSAPVDSFHVNTYSETGVASGFYWHRDLDSNESNDYSVVVGNGASRVAWVGLKDGNLRVRRSVTPFVLPTSPIVDTGFSVDIITSPISSSTHAPTKVYAASYIGTDIYVLFDSQFYTSGIALAVITDAGAVTISELYNEYSDFAPIGICDESGNVAILMSNNKDIYKVEYTIGALSSPPISTESFTPLAPSAADQYTGYTKIGATYYSLILDKQLFIEIKDPLGIHYGYDVGNEVIKTSTHKVYRNLVAGNLQDPEAGADGTVDATWIGIGPTNKWAAFDDKVITKTTSATSFSMSLTTVTYVNTVAFFGLENVESVDIEVKDELDNVIYTNSLDTLNVTPIYDFYTWVFYQRALTEETIDDNITPVPNPKITLTFNGTNLGVGLVAVGFSNQIGRVLSDTKSETLDYSERVYDEFGEISVIERPIINLNTYEILSDKSYNPYIQSLIKKLRSKNTLWIGDIGSGQKLITYGRYERSPIQYNMPNDVKYSITVRGSI